MANMPLAELEIFFRLISAMAFGAVVGLERELDAKPAGLRTHMLICLGAALFTVISILIEGPNVDNSRVVANVATGIGFLGAGAVFRGKDHVSGLTTAADIWVVGAIGAAAGLGLYSAAAIATVLTVGILWLKRKFRPERK